MSDYPPTVPPATPPPPGGGSYTPPPPPPPSGGGGYTPGPGPGPGAGAGDRTLWLILSYLGIFCLIPLFAKKDDSEVQWHAKNGTALFLAELAVGIGLFVISMLVRGMMGCALGVILGTLQCLIWLGVIVVSVYCMIQAVNGKRPRLPVITDFAEKL
jgi:uncharacterized membrane protein